MKQVNYQCVCDFSSVLFLASLYFLPIFPIMQLFVEFEVAFECHRKLFSCSGPPLFPPEIRWIYIDIGHSVPECGFEGLKQQQPPAHIWDLPRLWKSLLLMYKIFDRRTCGLSHQIKGPTTVKLAKSGFNCKIVKFTITGPLI